LSSSNCTGTLKKRLLRASPSQPFKTSAAPMSAGAISSRFPVPLQRPLRLLNRLGFLQPDGRTLLLSVEGIAGLNAALVLQDAGYSSTIYEASSRIGGRMHSDTTSWEKGQITEHCGEFIDSNHKTILGLARRFGIDVSDLIAAEPTQT